MKEFKDYVCTRKQAKKLNELRVNQEVFFYEDR